MLAKLLALLAQSKGAAVAVVLLAGATTATVAATNPDVESTFQQLTNSSNTSEDSKDCTHGQPVVVAQRNAADKLMRDAYQKDHKALEDMRGKGANNDLIRQWDDQLRSDLNTGLNKVAGLTLGRDGQNRDGAAASSDGSASASAAAHTTASPTPSGSAAANANTTCVSSTSSTASPSPKTSTSPATATGAAANVDARVAVADRTTLDAAIQQIVDDTIKAMDKDVTDATTAIKNASPAPDHGKPSDNPGNKPDNAGRPSASPKH
ncbi:MAG TPA: hypothetical protein VI814_00865 [Candidatus Limnocylindria bacterium]